MPALAKQLPTRATLVVTEDQQLLTQFDSIFGDLNWLVAYELAGAWDAIMVFEQIALLVFDDGLAAESALALRARQAFLKATLLYPTRPRLLILTRGVTAWSVGERTTVLAHTDLVGIRRHIYSVLEFEDAPTMEVRER